MSTEMLRRAEALGLEAAGDGLDGERLSLPVSSITSQATQRVALPQASASEPSLFQMRMKTSPRSVGSMAMTWSAPAPVSRVGDGARSAPA